jgi:L-fuconolactonase
VTDSPRIDAHHHLWDLAVRDQPWTASFPALRRSFDLDELRPWLRRHDIGATVLVQTVCIPEETPELLALAAADPLVRGVVGWADLTAPDVADGLAALRALPGGRRLAGIRHQVQEEPNPRWLCRPDVRHGLAAVSEADLVYDLVVRAGQLPAVIETVCALPNLRFVLDHGGKPDVASSGLEPWRWAITELAGCPNVAVKLSGLATQDDPPSWNVVRLQPYVTALLDTFGPARTMFGSDWPVCLLASSYTDVVLAAEQLTASLSAAERAQVFGGTAARWYGFAA